MPQSSEVPLSVIVTVNDESEQDSSKLPHVALNGDRATALHAASQASKEQLAQMKREIQELEQQVIKGNDNPGNLPLTVLIVLALYLTFGALQEGLIKHALHGRGGVVPDMQFICYTVFAATQHKFSEKRRTPIAYYCILALLQVATVGLS
eukprot:CAMPEP_0172212244 /NCGR_PEP_ID=MMETSP1050-20130122/36883_1 /TAXON_ID=233186 /ORGANISM="Cryptomonas curvata, Strain CCAP979/52" /LENGTH=150 /DNA_ID=CAMNT_0012892851 /DNA_START=14 /DNA_END=461 /DNA_ORIENTATION=+